MASRMIAIITYGVFFAAGIQVGRMIQMWIEDHRG